MHREPARTTGSATAAILVSLGLVAAMACGRVEFGIESLYEPPEVEPPECIEDDECDEGYVCIEETCEEASVIPWSDPYERYPWDTDYFAEVVQPMFQTDGCVTCHVIDYAYPPRFHVDPAPGSAEMWHNFEQAIALIDLSGEAEHARLVLIPLHSESHVTTNWHESRQGEAAFEPVVEWIRDAQSVQRCYENRYEDVVEHDGPAIWSSPCDPGPDWSCWPHEECPDDEEPPDEEENGEDEGQGEEEDGGG